MSYVYLYDIYTFTHKEEKDDSLLNTHRVCFFFVYAGSMVAANGLLIYDYLKLEDYFLLTDFTPSEEHNEWD